MRKNYRTIPAWRVIAAVVLAVVVLSSVDVTYVWYAPLDTPEGPADWYSEIGVRSGILLLANHEALNTGLATSVHLPEFFPLPFYVGAGPEGGGMFVALWLFAPAACGFVLLVRSRFLKRPASSHANPDENAA